VKTFWWLTGSVWSMDPERSSTKTMRVSRRVAVAVAAATEVLCPRTRMNVSGTLTVAETEIV
jgi:hypothetical protein